MDDKKFDSIVKLLGKGSSRRVVLKGLLGLGGTAVTGTIVPDDSAARGITSPTRIPEPPPPSCPSGQQLCNGICCDYGQCYNGVCCPSGQSGCGTGCCVTGQCTETGECCAAGQDVCRSICCPDGTCGRIYNTDVCCASPELRTTSGECCETELQRCDTDCCPADTVCLTRVFPENAFVEEEVCCPQEQTCDGQCCTGHCFTPLGSSVTGFERECCPAEPGFTFCPGLGEFIDEDLCCSGETPDCCHRPDGSPICLTVEQCCTDTECIGLTDPANCLQGFCNIPANFSCDTRSVCAEGDDCCEGGDNVCCSPDRECCGAVCCAAGLVCCPQTGQCTELGTDANCSACGDVCLGCQSCQEYAGSFSCQDDDTRCPEGCSTCQNGVCGGDCRDGEGDSCCFGCQTCNLRTGVCVDADFKCTEDGECGVGTCYQGLCTYEDDDALCPAQCFTCEDLTCVFDCRDGGTASCCSGCQSCDQTDGLCKDDEALCTGECDICYQGACIDDQTLCAGECDICYQGACIDDQTLCTAECDICYQGACIDDQTLCAGACDICYQGACIDDQTLCAGECDICYQGACIDDQTLCTAECDICYQGACIDDQTLCAGACDICYQGACIDDQTLCAGACDICYQGACIDDQTLCAGACDICYQGACIDDQTLCAGACDICYQGACIDDQTLCTGGCEMCYQGACVSDGTECNGVCCLSPETCYFGICCPPASASCAGVDDGCPCTNGTFSGVCENGVCLLSCQDPTTSAITSCANNPFNVSAVCCRPVGGTFACKPGGGNCQCDDNSDCFHFPGQCCQASGGSLNQCTSSTQFCTLTGANGEPCTDGAQCDSNICCNGACAETCTTSLSIETSETPCTPLACGDLAVTCGTWDDGCGGTVDCGCCPRDYCNDGECGLVDDGCGGSVDCGECPCVPTTTCDGLCGLVTDDCGGTLDCGACPCVPTTTCDGLCGLVIDDCGGTLDCGACPDTPPTNCTLALGDRCVNDEDCCEGLCRGRGCASRGRKICVLGCEGTASAATT